MTREIEPRLAYAQPQTFGALDMGRTISGVGPMVDILAKASEHLANEPDILDISIQAGFDWSDKKHLGPSVMQSKLHHARSSALRWITRPGCPQGSTRGRG